MLLAHALLVAVDTVYVAAADIECAKSPLPCALSRSHLTRACACGCVGVWVVAGLLVVVVVGEVSGRTDTPRHPLI